MKSYKSSSSGLWFIAPFFLIFFIFQGITIIASFVLSFSNMNPMIPNRPWHWEGLYNYQLLLGDSLFLHSLLNTFYSGGAMIVAQHLIAVPVAWMVFSNYRRHIAWIGILILLPNILPGSARVSAFEILTQAFFKFAKPIVEKIAGDESSLLGAFSQQNLVLFSNFAGSLIGMLSWNILLYMVAMSTIPRSRLEAAQLDGAGFWNQLGRIVLPGIRPMFFILLVISLFRGFGLDASTFSCSTSSIVDDKLVTVGPLIFCNLLRYQLYGPTGAILWAILLLIALMIGALYFAVGRHFENDDHQPLDNVVDAPLFISRRTANFLRIASLILCAICLFPLLMLITKALGGGVDQQGIHYGMSETFSILMRAVPTFWRNVWNTFYIAAMASILGVTVVSLAGYAFALLDFKYKKGFFSLVMAGVMAPSAFFVVPQLVENRIFNWLGFPRSVWVPMAASALAVFLVRQYVQNKLTTSTLEAAAIDGASEFRTFWSVGLPNMIPVLVVTALIVFSGTWYQWFVPELTFLSKELKTIPALFGFDFGIAHPGYRQFPFPELRGLSRVQSFASMATLLGSLPLLLISVLSVPYLAKGLGIEVAKEVE